MFEKTAKLFKEEMATPKPAYNLDSTKSEWADYAVQS